MNSARRLRALHAALLACCAGILAFNVCAACSPDLGADPVERSFLFASHPDDEVLYILYPSVLGRPRAEYTLFGDCRIVRAEVWGPEFKRAGEPVEEYLSRDDCTTLVARFVATGFVDTDKNERERKLARILPRVHDMQGIFIRLRLLEYQSPSKTETKPFEQITGAVEGLGRLYASAIDKAENVSQLSELEKLLNQNDALLALCRELDETYAPSADQSTN